MKITNFDQAWDLNCFLENLKKLSVFYNNNMKAYKIDALFRLTLKRSPGHVQFFAYILVLIVSKKKYKKKNYAWDLLQLLVRSSKFFIRFQFLNDVPDNFLHTPSYKLYQYIQINFLVETWDFLWILKKLSISLIGSHP